MDPPPINELHQINLKFPLLLPSFFKQRDDRHSLETLRVRGNRPARLNCRGLTIAPLFGYKHARMEAPMQDVVAAVLAGFPVPMQVAVFTSGNGCCLDVEYCFRSISRI